MSWGFDPDQRLWMQWIPGVFFEPRVKGQFTSSEDQKEVPKSMNCCMIQQVFGVPFQPKFTQSTHQ